MTVTIDGAAVSLGPPSAERLQMLLFERGHWCASCRRHLALVSDHFATFAGKSIDIVAITHESDVDLLGRTYPFPVVPDPQMDIATRFELVGPDELGKVTIRPATIVVGAGGKILFSYVGDDSRDRPTIPALLLALDATPGLNV